jgi:formylglycine-generating enzyme required for sulfatase activity
MFEDHTYAETALPGCPFEMVRLPGGSFIMGATKDKKHPNYDPEARDDETPHEVTLSPFLIGKYPVTQRLWTAVMEKNPSYFLENGEEKPVEQVSWYDAAVFCNRLSRIAGRKPCYWDEQGGVFGLKSKVWELPNEGRVRCDYTADGYRLPTEAQWEYAARGGLSALPVGEGWVGARYAGSDVLETVGWFDKNSGGSTRPAGLLLPNEFGLYDLSGNVWEWCADWYGAYKNTTNPDPTGPEQGDGRVLRGGSWDNPVASAQSGRTACRGNGWPDYRYGYIGFRLVLQSVDNHTD